MPKPLSKTDLELRKWCIEQAARWPTVRHGEVQGTIHGIPNIPCPAGESDVDLIGRATKILDWVQGTK